jgi:hypothetical protein
LADSVAKVPNGAAANFPPKSENKRQLPINAASNPVLESSVSLAHGGVVPHIIFQSPRLRPGEFESRPAKRLLQEYRRKAEKTVVASIRLAGGCEGSHDLVDAGFKLGDRERFLKKREVGQGPDASPDNHRCSAIVHTS